MKRRDAGRHATRPTDDENGLWFVLLGRLNLGTRAFEFGIVGRVSRSALREERGRIWWGRWSWRWGRWMFVGLRWRVRVGGCRCGLVRPRNCVRRDRGRLDETMTEEDNWYIWKVRQKRAYLYQCDWARHADFHRYIHVIHDDACGSTYPTPYLDAILVGIVNLRPSTSTSCFNSMIYPISILTIFPGGIFPILVLKTSEACCSSKLAGSSCSTATWYAALASCFPFFDVLNKAGADVAPEGNDSTGTVQWGQYIWRFGLDWR